ncbi:MAG: hypothetical protein ABIV50_05410 [Opitutus sp.]
MNDAAAEKYSRKFLRAMHRSEFFRQKLFQRHAPSTVYNVRESGPKWRCADKAHASPVSTTAAKKGKTNGQESIETCQEYRPEEESRSQEEVSDKGYAAPLLSFG